MQMLPSAAVLLRHAEHGLGGPHQVSGKSTSSHTRSHTGSPVGKHGLWELHQVEASPGVSAAQHCRHRVPVEGDLYPALKF